jgi:hypothetical protein
MGACNSQVDDAIAPISTHIAVNCTKLVNLSIMLLDKTDDGRKKTFVFMFTPSRLSCTEQILVTTAREHFQSVIMAELSKKYRIQRVEALQHDTTFRVVVTHPSPV